MSGDRMEAKLRGYLAYHKQQRYAQKYQGMKIFQVLTITETASRARYLEQHLSILPTGPARRAYRFVPFQELWLEGIVPQSSQKLTERLTNPCFRAIQTGCSPVTAASSDRIGAGLQGVQQDEMAN